MKVAHPHTLCSNRAAAAACEHVSRSQDPAVGYHHSSRPATADAQKHLPRDAVGFSGVAPGDPLMAGDGVQRAATDYGEHRRGRVRRVTQTSGCRPAEAIPGRHAGVTVRSSMDLQLLSASQVKLTVEQDGALRESKTDFSREWRRIQKWLTFVPTEEGVKRLVAVILDDRFVSVLRARHKFKPSVEQRLGFSTVSYFRKTTLQ